MSRMLKNLFLLGIFGAAALRALARSFGGTSEAATKTHPRRRAAHSNAKRAAWTIATFLAVVAAGGLLTVVGGLVSIKASSGHWPITAALLNFTMRRSVIMHSLGIETPPLDDRTLVLKGAAHYEIGCSPCHGSPAMRQPVIPLAMTPHPPELSKEVSKWRPRELFYIVKHGVKFTGMPAWPAQERGDEVWAMVAFLRALPKLNADEYRRLIRDDAGTSGTISAGGESSSASSVPRLVNDNCSRCHGSDGAGRDSSAFPKLAGQNPNYFYLSMEAYARGQRNSGIMEPIAAALSPEAMRDLARYYSDLAQPPSSPRLSQDNPAIERGKQIAEQGIPNQRVPICVECHGPGPDRRNPNYPELAGQYAEYLILQLTLFKKQQRGGTAYAHLMQRVAPGLTEQQMIDVASYYESLPRSGRWED
jgi:cytochrome c553